MRIRAREGTSEAGLDRSAEERLRVELDAQREVFDRELVRRAYRISELEEELEQARRDYEDSLSWRITTPLRSVKSRLRGRG